MRCPGVDRARPQKEGAVERNVQFDREHNRLWRRTLELGIPKQVLQKTSILDIHRLIQLIGASDTNPSAPAAISGTEMDLISFKESEPKNTIPLGAQ